MKNKQTTLSVLRQTQKDIREIRKGVGILVAGDTIVQGIEKQKDGYFTITDEAKLKTSEMMNELREKFNVYSYWNNNELDKNFPKPIKATTRYFNKSQDPDTETLNKSYDDLKAEKKEFCTLREYILMFMQYHEETGKYLDEKGWTVFSDSLPGGDVAYGYWHPDHREVKFIWYHATNVLGRCGARLAFSLNS